MIEIHALCGDWDVLPECVMKCRELHAGAKLVCMILYECIEAHGEPVHVRFSDLCEMLQIDPPTARGHLASLETQGFLHVVLDLKILSVKKGSAAP